MDELRLVRREEQSLVVASEAGEEFRLVVDDTVLSELRHLSRKASSGATVRPREIQSLIRAGKTREEVIEITGLTADDVERYEEPVLAERRYVLERAQAVAVRTGNGEEGNEQFGTVISERLQILNADAVHWSSWRDEEAGWMVTLDFVSHKVEHQAIWGFEHRKGVLSPLNSDAVNLSKQGEVGDRLIPKLRAVDSPERGAFDAGEFGPESESEKSADPADPRASGGSTPHPGDTHDLGATPLFAAEAASTSDRASQEEEVDDEAEYVRRREIDQRAISTTAESGSDLGQTADLLDALRKRRGERENATNESTDLLKAGDDESAASDDYSNGAQDQAAKKQPEADASVPKPGPRKMSAFHKPQRNEDTQESTQARPDADGGSEAHTGDRDSESDGNRSQTDPVSSNERSSKSQRRASIPSWDDILFGTRSDEDPTT